MQNPRPGPGEGLSILNSLGEMEEAGKRREGVSERLGTTQGREVLRARETDWRTEMVMGELANPTDEDPGCV